MTPKTTAVALILYPFTDKIDWFCVEDQTPVSKAGQWLSVKGQRGRAQLLIDGHTYFRTKDYGHITYWLCTKTKKQRCMARLCTDMKKQSYTFTNSVHSHAAMPVKSKEGIFFTDNLEDLFK